MSKITFTAPSSGSGKTTVVCGVLKALKNRGLRVAACKCGPDYIDPMFHTKILGVPSKNLDGFFCDEKMLEKIFNKHSADSDITVVEGVMGYYDGLSMQSTRASTYEVAKCISSPVVLVVNAKGMALSVNALIKGIMDYRGDSNIVGVILNNVSQAVFLQLKDVIRAELGIEVLGYFPPLPDCAIESRHLGLITPSELEDLNNKIERLGEIAESCIDIDLLLSLAKSEKKEFSIEKAVVSESCRIAIARDNAFCFYYSDNLEILKDYGCELCYFSPLTDDKLPQNIDGIILGGGYPELYAKQLSENKAMLADIRTMLENGMPCLAECGGFMYLHNSLQGNDGKMYKMAGVIDADATKCNKLVRFGYKTLTANSDSFILKKGEEIKAHEFHYWDSTDNGEAFSAQKPNGKNSHNCMHIYKNTVCGYPHLFYPSNPDFVRGFIDKCRGWR